MVPTNHNILISAAGRRVELLRAFKHELNAFNPNAQVFATDIKTSLSSASRIADKAYDVLPIIHPDYISQLLQLCIGEKVGLIIPTIDTELQLLADHKGLFEEHNIQVMVSDADLIKHCRDKRLTNQLFNSLGINVPKQYTKTDYQLPLFIKPYNGSLSVDNYIIRSSSELTNYHMSNDDLMFMEYIDAKSYQEYTIDMYYGKDHQLKMAVPRLRILVRAGEINKGKTIKNELLNQLCLKMAKLPGAIGCLTVQVFFNPTNQHVIGIEINPRFGGGYPLSYHAGANYPKLILQEYFNNINLNYSDDWEPDLLMLRYDDAIFVHGYKD